jgi:hypothetical protein
MGRKASRKWVTRARRYSYAGHGERRRLRLLFGGDARFWRAVLVGLALLVLARPAAGQVADVCTGPAEATVCTGPITAAMRIEFTAPTNVVTVTGANALEPRVYVDGSTTVFHALAEVCTGATAPFQCTAPIPPALLTVLNVAGLHSVGVKLFDPSTGTEGPSAIPFVLRSPPGAPSGVRIIR